MKILFYYQFISVLATKIRFPVLGDWGGKDGDPYYTEAQERVADIMNEHCKVEECDFMISIG